MKKWSFSLFLLLFSLSAQAAELRIAVASNFLATLQALVPLFEQEEGDRPVVSGASSGKLYAQIMHGAPFDLLLSADRHYTQRLIDNGKALADNRTIYATGQLVLWSGQPLPISVESLLEEGVQHIAIANPKTAPYGKAAWEVMEKRNIWPKIEGKVVRGESVGQAFQFVATGNAQLGFVALSQVLNPFNRQGRNYYWLVPQSEYQPLEQEAVQLKQGSNPEGAARFLRFLRRPDIQQKIREFGYR